MYTVFVHGYNGYLCCCHRKFDHPREYEVETWEEVIAILSPDKLPLPDEEDDPDWKVHKIKVVDKEGHPVASGRKEWPLGYYRGSGYAATRWCGYYWEPGASESTDFEAVYGPADTWEGCLTVIKAKGAKIRAGHQR